MKKVAAMKKVSHEKGVRNHFAAKWFLTPFSLP